METLSIDTSKQGLLASQPINKLFWRYTLPAVVGMMVNGLYTTIDGIFIGQVVGADALAAMNLIWPVFGIIIGIGLMCGVGAGALYSINRGEGKHEAARHIFGSSLSLMLFASPDYWLVSLLSGSLGSQLDGR